MENFYTEPNGARIKRAGESAVKTNMATARHQT